MLKPHEDEMVQPTKLSFSRSFFKEGDGKGASWLHSHVGSLYSVIKFCDVLADVPVPVA